MKIHSLISHLTAFLLGVFLVLVLNEVYFSGSKVAATKVKEEVKAAVESIPKETAREIVREIEIAETQNEKQN